MIGALESRMANNEAGGVGGRDFRERGEEKESRSADVTRGFDVGRVWDRGHQAA